MHAQVLQFDGVQGFPESRRLGHHVTNRPKPSRLWLSLGFASSTALWLLVAGPPGAAPVPRWAGMLLFHLLAALLIRWLLVRKQQPRPRLWSPWLFLIAAGVALLGRVGPS